MYARTLRYHVNVSRQFRDSSRWFGESIRKPIANSSHPSEIGALPFDFIGGEGDVFRLKYNSWDPRFRDRTPQRLGSAMYATISS